MDMDHNPIIMMHDNASVTHWAQAMDIRVSAVFNEPNCNNVYQYCLKNDVRFRPRRDRDGLIVDDKRLEHFRLAMLHAALANAVDIGTHLDDDLTDTLEGLTRLTANDPDENGNPTWLTVNWEYNIVWRTLDMS